MQHDSSRRALLAAVGATAVSLSGCLERITGDESENGADREGETRAETDGESDEGETGDDELGDDSDSGESGDGDHRWPAIEAGELISDFESLERWEARSGTIEADDDARIGTQAAAIESDGDVAEATIAFPDGLDLEGWDASLAVKIESATRMLLEVVTTNREHRLTSVRQIPDAYEGWLRIDFGYIQKFGEPDLENVSRLNVIANGPEGGPTRIVVDDLRRTEAVDNGKAVLAFYGGHDSHYEIAAPMLEEREWTATVPVDPERIGGQGRMDVDELLELQERGWDVCAHPRSWGSLPELSDDDLERALERTQAALEDSGFEDGARHLFAPNDSLSQTAHEAVRDRYESGVLFGASPTGAPPTGIHAIPRIWGPDLHGGVRRAINLCDQYDQLVVLRIPRVVDGEADSNSVSVDDLEHLLDHIAHRGLDVVTLSDVVDGNLASDGRVDDDVDEAEGTILEAGQSVALEGSGSETTDEFELSEGLLVGSFSHDGDGAFGVELEARDASSGGLLVATDGGGPGESVMVVEEGTYALVVDADDQWSIDLDQPEVHSDDLESVPAEAAGSGSSFVGPLWTDDDLSLEVTHDGDGEFIVDGHGANGSREALINQTGEFDGSRSYSASGTFWIDVEADGDWTLEIR